MYRNDLIFLIRVYGILSNTYVKECIESPPLEIHKIHCYETLQEELRKALKRCIQEVKAKSDVELKHLPWVDKLICDAFSTYVPYLTYDKMHSKIMDMVIERYLARTNRGISIHLPMVTISDDDEEEDEKRVDDYESHFVREEVTSKILHEKTEQVASSAPSYFYFTPLRRPTQPVATTCSSSSSTIPSCKPKKPEEHEQEQEEEEEEMKVEEKAPEEKQTKVQIFRADGLMHHIFSLERKLDNLDSMVKCMSNEKKPNEENDEDLNFIRRRMMDREPIRREAKRPHLNIPPQPSKPSTDPSTENK